MAIEWITPKTDWKSTDRFNLSDYSRIKGNMEYIRARSEGILTPYNFEEMSQVTAYTAIWNVDDFNRFERNLSYLQKSVPSLDFGTSQTFYENGRFIGASELNRIESALFESNELISRQYFGLRRLVVRLGNWQINDFSFHTPHPKEPDWYRFDFRFGNKRGAIK